MYVRRLQREICAEGSFKLLSLRDEAGEGRVFAPLELLRETFWH